jgi:hypothetical protein
MYTKNARLIAKHRANGCCLILQELSVCKSEILGNKLEDFFFLAFLLPKMYIDYIWKETILRGKMMLNRSQILLNTRQLKCAFMFNDTDNLAPKWLL